LPAHEISGVVVHDGVPRTVRVQEDPHSQDLTALHGVPTHRIARELRGDSFLRFASLAVPGFDVCDDELFVTFQVADSVYVPMPQSVTERLFDMAPTRIQRSVEPVSVRVGESFVVLGGRDIPALIKLLGPFVDG